MLYCLNNHGSYRVIVLAVAIEGPTLKFVTKLLYADPAIFSSYAFFVVIK